MSLCQWGRPVVVALLLAATASAADAPPTKAEIGKRGKAATAFVVAKADVGRAQETRQGSAFCIHPSGLFLTSLHVVRNANSIELVTNSAEKDQKVFKATVLRQDEKADLALLRAETSEELPALPIGDDSALEELSAVVACGYPFGTGLAFEKKDYPSITLTSGAIASLRKKEGDLELIQLDVSLNPGNSGGPVLDANGKVIGLVLGGIRGTQINFCVPARKMIALAAKPEIDFTPPPLRPEDRGKVVAVEARLISVLPAEKAPEVELVVRRGTAVTRHPMALEKGSYRANAVLLPGSTTAAKYGVEASFADGAVRGTLKDCPITVGAESFKLSDMSAVYPGDKPRAVLRSGKQVEGKLGGLDAVGLTIGGQELTVNLTAAEQVQVRGLDTDPLVVLEVVAKAGGKEVATASRPVLLDEGNKVYLVDLQPLETRVGPWPLGLGTTGDTEGTPIKVAGTAYPKGLGLHVDNKPDPSMARYRLNKTATAFRAGVAINDSNKGQATGPVHFEVMGDGKLLWKSKDQNTWRQAEDCLVDVTSVEVLEVRTVLTGNGYGAHTVWLDPHLIGADAAAIRRATGKK